MADPMDEYRHFDSDALTRGQIKVLLGALSWEFDDKLTQRGLDPVELRSIALQFTSQHRMIEVEPKIMEELEDLIPGSLLFNSFVINDVFYAGDG